MQTDLNTYKRQQTTHKLILKLVTKYTLKQATWKMGSKVESCLQNCPHKVQWNYLHIENQATGKTRPCNVKEIVHELPVKLWNVDT